MQSNHLDGTTLSRQELYDRIWKTPASKLAKEFGISDVGLAKVCKRHNIPRPPRGYWARLANGQRIRQTALPPSEADQDKPIRIIGGSYFLAEAPSSGSDAVDAEILVPDELTEPHDLITLARQVLRKSKAGESGLLRADRSECLEINVTRQSLDRALRIYDTLIKHWVGLGGQVFAGQPQPHGEPITEFGLDADRIAVGMSEEVKRIPRDPKVQGFYRFSNCKYEPTGHLVLELRCGTYGMRSRWADGKVRRLETAIRSFSDGVQAILARQRADRLDKECIARQNAIIERVRASKNAQNEIEMGRRKQLEADLRGWNLAKELRAYLTELDAKIASGDVAVRDKGAFAAWRQWASWYSQFVDPLSATPPRPENPPVPKNVPVSELDLTRETRAVVQQLGADTTDSLFKTEFATWQKLKRSWMNSEWNEICRALEGLHYEVADRYKTGYSYQ